MPRAGAPRRITSNVVGHTVTLGWQPGPAPAAQVFIVEAGTAPGSANVGRFNVGPATSVAGTLGTGRYFVRVRGVGATGEGPASNDVAVDVPAIAAPPEAPGTLAASVSGTTVSLAWGLATGNATTYVIEAGSASGLSNLVTFPTGNLDTALVTAAPPGRYYVRVRAANASGPGPASNEVVIDVP
jgi:predicted phage tail protein